MGPADISSGVDYDLLNVDFNSVDTKRRKFVYKLMEKRILAKPRLVNILGIVCLAEERLAMPGHFL